MFVWNRFNTFAIYLLPQTPTLSSLQCLSSLTESGLVMMRAFQVGDTSIRHESTSDLSVTLIQTAQHIRHRVLKYIQADSAILPMLLIHSHTTADR